MSGAEAPGKVSIGISRRYGIFREIVLALGRLLVGFTVHGAERVPRSGPLVIVSNHRRYLDPVYVSMAVPRRLQWMGKKELFIPPFDRLFYFTGCFPVDRQGGGRAALRSALRYLGDGAALGIFPEGTRRKEGEENRDAPKNGAVMLASRGGARVLPVHVGPVPNPLQRLRGGRLEVHVGEPQTLKGVSGKQYGETGERLIRDIHALPVEDG